VQVKTLDSIAGNVVVIQKKGLNCTSPGKREEDYILDQ